MRKKFLKKCRTYLLSAIQSVLVEDVLTSRLHHHTTTDGIPRIGKDTRSDSDNLNLQNKTSIKIARNLSNGPSGEEVELLIGREDSLGGIEHSEVSSTVDDDSLDGDEESTVQSDRSVGLDDLEDTVGESLEFTVSSLSDISSETSTGEVKRVDEAQGGGSGSSSGGEVSNEELPEFLLLINSIQEHLLVGVLEGEVQSLGGEVSDDVSEVSTP